jgi:hypothetical protein
MWRFILLAGKNLFFYEILWIEMCIFRGPDDNGLVVDGPGILATTAFEKGALNVSEMK